MENKVRMLEEKAKEIRKLTIQAIGELGVGHIGGALSLCEVLSVLYFDARISMRLFKNGKQRPVRAFKRPRRAGSLCDTCT